MTRRSQNDLIKRQLLSPQQSVFVRRNTTNSKSNENITEYPLDTRQRSGNKTSHGLRLQLNLSPELKKFLDQRGVERHLISEANFLYFQKLSICTSSYLNDVNTETFTFILTNDITRHWFKARSPSKTTLVGIFQRRIFWKRIFNRFIEL